MKLEKYEDNSKKKRKVILISISVIVLISISLLLYKTFASFTESAEFPMMNGKVDYFGNSDVYFAFYQGDKELTEMPQKDNKENLIFDHGECDNGASIIWDGEAWGPIVKNLSKSKTKCTLHFGKIIELDKNVILSTSGDGLYKVEHNVSEISTDWNKTEYRYVGTNPNNYVKFNNEIWRIIGLVNVKVNNSVEQRVKIVRQDGIEGQNNFGEYSWDKQYGYVNNWAASALKDMLNGIYYESGIGDCYISTYGGASECDFKTGTTLPKGLDETARSMVDKDVIWNLGGWTDVNISTKQFYEKERGITVYGKLPTEWSNETEVGGKHNGIGLINPSDYGYATSSEVRDICLEKNIDDFYKDNCYTNDWLKPNQGRIWTLFPYSTLYEGAVIVDKAGYVIFEYNINNENRIWPTLYLTQNTKIVDGTGDINSPFVLSIQ